MVFKRLSRYIYRMPYAPCRLRDWRRGCHAAAQQESRIPENSESMSVWQFNSYGDESNAQLVTNVKLPIIEGPNDVLVKVAAASVNPLDVEMMRGFGSVLLKTLRQIEFLCEKNHPEFPLILGRDFAGVVIAKGSSVSSFELGDEIYGVVKPQNRGCHAEYAVTSNTLCAKKTDFLSMEEASAILYTSLTAWSALKISGGLLLTPASGKRVLVLGASGGVGHAAVQLLHAWGAKVIATCRTDAIPIVEKLSPDLIIDYTSSEYTEEIKAAGSYDIVLDAAGLSEVELEKYVDVIRNRGSIVTLRSPLLTNIDQHGLIAGSIKSAVDLILPNLTSGVFKKGSLIKWAYFMPCEMAVKEISNLVNEKKILPTLEKIYPYSKTPEAYARMKAKHLRGKIVISMNEYDKSTETSEEK